MGAHRSLRRFGVLSGSPAPRGSYSPLSTSRWVCESRLQLLRTVRQIGAQCATGLQLNDRLRAQRYAGL